jgi:hypothetical protein
MAFYKQYDGIIFVFDTNYIDTFERIDQLMNEINPIAGTPIICIGTKEDLQHSGFFKGVEYFKHPLYQSLQDRGFQIIGCSLVQNINMNIWRNFFDQVCNATLLKPTESVTLNLF